MAGNGLPRENQKAIRDRLQRIAIDSGIEVPRSANGNITLSTKAHWKDHRDVDPFIDLYCEFKEKNKLRSFLAGLDVPRIHPRYKPLVRTGRTSCEDPNIQQLPRFGSIREVIVARPGSVFFIIDYSILELRTLAAECYRRFGQSKLREALIQGNDPHSYTVAMFEKLTLEEFSQLPESRRKLLRQRAKAFNFGIPVGLGPKALVESARQSYGVELTIQEAEDLIHRVTREIYPELGIYLSEDSMGILARNLGADPLEVRATWPEPYRAGMLKKILAGNRPRA